MARKTEEERLKEIQEKMEQLRVKEQQLKAKVSQKERKERTRRLIQIGAVFEKWFELASIEEAEEVAQALNQMAKAHLEKKKGTRAGE
jgi:predicted aconitase